MAITKIIKRVSYQDTLLCMPIGSELIFNKMEARAESVRRACYTLNKRGYNYTATDKGFPCEIKVTRNK